MCLIFTPPILNTVPHAPLLNCDGNGDVDEDGDGGEAEEEVFWNVERGLMC